VHLQYFALIREERGLERETLQSPALTYRDLYNQLKSTHGFSLPAEMIQVAVNDEFTSLDHTLESDARVVFIPPVAGG
jgi:molybdopterin converting factor small subunit